MDGLKKLIAGDDLIVAPLALNAFMARLAEAAGFRAAYLSGGSLGWLKCVTEANLTLPEMVDVVIEIRTACDIPVVVDAGGGWGDPVHMHRTIAMSEAAGVAALEIEDQLLPRRVHHHIGVEHLVPTELIVAKLQEAVAARTDPELVIIGRTNARRMGDLDEALRRGEAMHEAGADMLFIDTREPDEMRIVSERLPGPFMIFAPHDGFAGFALTPGELAGLGFRLAAAPATAFAAMHKAVRETYAHMAEGTIYPFLGQGGAADEMRRAHQTTDLDKLIEIEKRTMGIP